MHRIQAKVAWSFAVVAILAAVSQVAMAQPGERGRGRGQSGPGGGGRDFGGFPITSLRLAANDKVATELKLTDDQKKKVKEVNDKFMDDLRASFGDGGGREKMQELYAGASTKLNEILDEGQQKRLMGILIQVNGANAVADPAVAKELNVTEDQKTKLQEAREANMQTMRDAFDELRDQNPSGDDMRSKMEKLREEANKKLMAVLTTEQQKQLEELKGEKFEIDMRDLRGPGGGFRGRFGDRGDRRGGRDREDRDSEKSKDSDDSESK